MRDHPDLAGVGVSRDRSVGDERAARERGLLVGRDVEVAMLADFLAAGQSTPQALVLDGEAGIGKTTLFDATVMEGIRFGPREGWRPQSRVSSR